MKRLFLFLSVIFCFHFCYGQTQTAKAPLLDNNPVIITPGKANISSKIIAVLFSGDGGWFSFEQSLADNLANSGIPTIGIDTKKYFWSRKSPETTASDVARLLRYYGNEWDKSEYMLIGYSLGAEIVPFVQTRLPEELKDKVISLVMLSPETKTDFEIHISNMVGMGSKQNTYDVLAEISRVEKTRQICVFGDDENSNVPGLLKSTHVEIIFVPGKHHYQGNAALIIQKVKEKKGF